MAREAVLQVRLSHAEKARLAQLAERDGRTMGEYLRYLVQREALYLNRRDSLRVESA